MLWKFYKNDPDICNYLFGTMHVATDEAYTYLDLAKLYIGSSTIYAGEMNLNESFGQDIMPYFELADGGTFSDLFRPKQYSKYKVMIKRTFGLDLDNYQNNTPFYISNLLASTVLPKMHPLPLDHYLWQFAMSEGKEMLGLESFEDQVNILKQITLENQIKSFRDGMKNVKAFRHKIRGLNDLYAKGDAALLYKKSKRDMKGLRKLMIYDRNANMVERILDISGNKASFFAVGAAHFHGGKGILALLKKEGYTINNLLPK